jgi:hypothetical protein
MNKNGHRKQLDAEAARDAQMLLRDDVRTRLDQERAMFAFAKARTKLLATKAGTRRCNRLPKSDARCCHGRIEPSGKFRYRP